MKYEEKLALLESNLKGYKQMALALSGGVDSTCLLLFAQKVLGDNLIAVTAVAPNFAPDEISYARELCLKKGIRHMVVDLGDEILSSFAHNPPDRCYLCKKAIFSRVKEQVLSQYPEAVIADGTNLDDMKDYRPGHKALAELSIASPLKEAGLTKSEIRRTLKDLGGDIWDKPAFACLASRIPYGETITPEKLAAVYKAESALHDLGFRQVRVRHHGNLARIEVPPEDREEFFDSGFMDRVSALVKDAGFLYVTLDLTGYRMGSLNEEIEE
ncbi:ATP-dependent sacrificial sulfur transferase LarE [Anaerovorax odorimutans]|uniref:ATP-dependent sacrificial sulfur transferase LarE n=1 Tax=Anaerovorax odorimutans TaxID=109327 RepID=A0ABT1RNC1_9FIRM|nr:ATP-dependent sacrificial sulfur transferase LarE [Anaerovorax odorimutans]MCQ4636680.1 ATP-dependent sacrificial sulfur transferase LarE [Anaerovorax odorimutans]